MTTDFPVGKTKIFFKLGFKIWDKFRTLESRRHLVLSGELVQGLAQSSARQQWMNEN